MRIEFSMGGQAGVRVRLWRYAMHIAALCMACNLYAASNETSSGFAVEGSLKCTFYRSNGEIFTNQVLAFEMEVSGVKWRLVNHEGASNRWVRGSDGSAVYHVFQPANNPYAQEAAMVEPGPMPMGAYPAAVPWIAFASAGQLGRKEGLFAPWADPYSEASVNAYEFKTSYFDEAPRLPRSIEFVVDQGRVNAFGDGRYIAREGMGLTERSINIARAALEPVGFVGGRYEVVNVTNINGMLLPTEFKLTKFNAQPPGPNRTNYPIAAVYHGTIQHIHAVSSGVVLPDISTKPVSIIDFRFRDNHLPIDSIHYILTNMWITDSNDKFLLGVNQAKIKSLPTLSKKDGRRLLILGIIITLVLVPVIKFLFSTFKQASKRKRLQYDSSKPKQD